jgi:ribosomal protein L32E
MSENNNDKLKELIKEHSVDGRISCEDAWQLADDIGAKKQEVGKAADELGIKVKSCQLGCF